MIWIIIIIVSLLKHCVMKNIAFLFVYFFIFVLTAQDKISSIKLVEADETSCRKIEEKLYLNSLLNQSIDNQNYIDSVKNCMGESPDFYLVTGKYLYNKKEYTNSITEFKKVIKSNSSNKKQLGEAFYYLGLASYYTQQYNTSYEYSKKALELGFKTSWTYNNMGLAIAEIDKWDEAISYFKKSLKINPSNDIAASNIGWMYSKIHNNKEALKYNLYADSIVNGNKAHYKSKIIRNLIELQREDEAFFLAENAYKKFPNDKNIIEDYSKVLFKQQKFVEILPLARKLLHMHPSSSNDWHSIAYIYDKAGQIDSAFYFYKLCLIYDPNCATAYYNIGSIYKDIGMFENAHIFIDKSLSIDSNCHYFYSGKVELYNWEHDFENAYLWSLKFKQRFPERKPEFKIGYSLQQLKRYSEAIPYFRTALINKPNDDRLLNNIGRCYAELGQQDSAFYYFENALKINPENSFVYHNRAALYYDIKKYDLACQDLKKAIDEEYNWIIDDKLIEMKEQFCPDINTNLKVLIYGYKGNNKELANYKFIQLSDSLLNEALDLTINEHTVPETKNEEHQTTNSFSSFNLYPNPTNGIFNIETQTAVTEVLTIKVYSSGGELVLLDSIAEGTKKSFDLSNVPNGIYAVIISNKNSILSTKKMVLEN